MWESVKLWDNASVSADYANARAEGSSVLGASYVAGGRAAGQAVGVEGLYNASSGFDYTGQKLTAGQRSLQGTVGSVQIVGSAVGLKQAGTAVGAVFKGVGVGESAASATGLRTVAEGYGAATEIRSAAFAPIAQRTPLPVTPKNVPHANSLSYVGDTHVYAIRGPKGVHKIGQSMQGLRVSDGASIRAEAQVRALNKEFGPGYYSEILTTLPDKASARAYETRLIERFRSMFGQQTLPGNKANW